MTLGTALSALGVLGLVAAERTGQQQLRRLFKPLASGGFLLAALGAPAIRLPHGPAWLLMAGLVSAACGDVLLLGKTRRAVAAGMAAFAVTYGAYGAWLAGRAAAWSLLAVSATLFLAVGHLVWRWLRPHLPPPMRTAVRAYVAIASLAAALAAARLADAARTGVIASKALLPAAGTLLLLVSDVAVARERFVAADWRNRAWGLPVYYGAQLLVASAVL